MHFMVFSNDHYVGSNNFDILQMAEILILFLLENVTCHSDTKWHYSVPESS